MNFPGLEHTAPNTICPEFFELATASSRAQPPSRFQSETPACVHPRQITYREKLLRYSFGLICESLIYADDEPLSSKERHDGATCLKPGGATETHHWISKTIVSSSCKAVRTLSNRYIRHDETNLRKKWREFRQLWGPGKCQTNLFCNCPAS